VLAKLQEHVQSLFGTLIYHGPLLLLEDAYEEAVGLVQKKSWKIRAIVPEFKGLLFISLFLKELYCTPSNYFSIARRESCWRQLHSHCS
jgi:hypothetical protein